MADPTTRADGRPLDFSEAIACCPGGRCGPPFETPLLEVALKGLWRFIARLRPGDKEPIPDDTTIDEEAALPTPSARTLAHEVSHD